MLKKFAAKGGIVKCYKRMGYELEKQSPELVDYSIDVLNLIGNRMIDRGL